MFKKVTLVGLGIALVIGILFGRDGFSYLHTTASHVKDSVKDSVPVEFEIERARKMVASLDPEIRKNMHLIAKEEVEVDRIRRQIERLEDKVGKERSDMARLSSDLKSNEDYLFYASRRYTKDQVRIDLASRLNRAQTKEATLTNLSKVLNAREQGLTAARQKLEEMLSSKRTLIVEVESLEARHKMNQVAQTACDFNVDNSQLARVKGCIDELESRVAANERFLNVEGEFHTEIPITIEPEVDGDIEDRVAAFLHSYAKPRAEVVVVADFDLE